tara:strand:+ start:703 stop:948 length:246 start_codon:yes stop_codon:yes gene_type:complete
MTKTTNPCPKSPSACANVDAWNLSVKTTRQAFYKMLELDEGCIPDIFDLVFGELTIDQLHNINNLIDAPVWKELYLQEKGQ